MLQETLRLPADVHSPAQAREWLAEVCSQWDCAELADDAALLISELTTNALLHTGTAMLVTADYEQSLLTVTVTDEQPAWVDHPRVSDDPEHGRGLILVETLAHDWGVNPNGTSKAVWFRLLDRPRSPLA